MTDPSVTAESSREVTAQVSGPYTHYAHGTADEETLKQAAALLHRLTGRGVGNARAAAQWADELIVYHDTHGMLGVHGFRILDVGEGRPQYRVVYTVFSAVDPRATNASRQLGQVALRIYGRERQRQPRLPVVWSVLASNAPDALEAPKGMQGVRRLIPDAASILPHNLRFFIDDGATVSGSGVPAVIETAIAGLIRDQRGVEKDAQSGRSFSGFRLTRVVPAGVTALAASAAVFFLMPRPAVQDGGPAEKVVPTRTKGQSENSDLHVYRQTAGGSEEAVSGDAFRPGDRIRFAVDLPFESRVKVLGLQSDGKLYAAWPQPGLPSVFGMGDQKLLDGAVTLDDALGKETLYLVACPANEPDTPCMRRGGPESDPVCAADCVVSHFVMKKVAISFR